MCLPESELSYSIFRSQMLVQLLKDLVLWTAQPVWQALPFGRPPAGPRAVLPAALTPLNPPIDAEAWFSFSLTRTPTKVDSRDFQVKSCLWSVNNF